MAISAKTKKVLKNIKLLLLDIDGVLTDGRVTWIEGTGWTATYSVIDGYGIRRMMKLGIEVGFISGGTFKSHQERAKILGVKHAYFGNEDKVGAYEKIKADLSLSDDEIAYVGDELFDIPLLERVAFAATVPHAPKKVCKVVDYKTKTPGGFGAVREVIEMILEAQGKA